MSRALPDQAGKVALVTGATGGIGLWTALGLMQAGAEVTITGRSPARLSEAAAFLARRSRRPAPRTELADFGSLRQVRDLASRFATRRDTLDVLVNNAGLITPTRMTSADGFEMILAVNHLAPFLLTRALLPMLRRAAQGRIVTVASTAHQRGRMQWDDLMLTRGWSPLRAYAQSKLANILFTVELARRLTGTAVTANAVHPGVVGTGFGAVGGLYGLAWRLFRPFLISPERGARTSLHVATAPDLGRVSGEYFAHGRLAVARPQARDREAAERLWAESERLVERALA